MKSLRQCTVTMVLFALLAPLGGCSSFRGLVGDLQQVMQLQQQLQQQTGQTGLTVNLNNGRFLLVNFVNSPLAKLPADQKKSKALQVARLAYRDWPKRTDLASITVAFVSNYDVGPVHYSNSTGQFSV